MKRLLALTTLLSAFGLTNTSADDALRRDAQALFGRIQPAPAAASAQAELGRALFWDTRASSDGKTACASCHQARDGGADSRRFSIDARAEATSRNSPTVFNAMSQPALRWLGDRKTGADQAEGSLTGSMGFASKDAGIKKLAALGYEPAFHKAFPNDAEPLSARNYGRAIEAYEATLATPAPFDRFLAGDDRALSAAQQAGLRVFIATGCASCHNGALLGGTALQRFGVKKDYWTETGSEKIDTGRFAATKKEEDRYVFRVPMLRNIGKTAPYFHDGSVADLGRAVRVMASVQLGKTLDDKSASAIVAFLDSLSGGVPANYAPPGQRPDSR